ncbi:MAG: nuclear transport factor 2 family protein [Gammaproteobacteria bacterium]|nr:nuclear transport factor 2 family protein [Gammaproteobacteria bacterium]
MLTYRTSSIWTILCMIGMLACSANSSELAELSAEELAGIRDLDSRFVSAYNRLDVDAFMDCLWKSPNLVVLLYDGTVFIGWDSVRKVTEEFLAGLESAHVQIDEVTFLRSGDAIMAVGTASYKLQPKDGPLQEFSARWTDFRRVEDGQWVYVSDHAQTLAPPTP